MNEFSHPVSAQDCLEQWRAAHNDVVERVFRSRLRRFPSEIEDGVQSFWLDFLEQERCERFDPALCPSKAGYVGTLARGRALNLLRTLMDRWRRTSSPEDSESSTPDETPDKPRENANIYLLKLVSTNRLEAIQALVLVSKVWINIGPAELADQHWNSTLLQLCDFITAHLEGRDDDLEVPRTVLRVLREQLALPPNAPLSKQTLMGLVPGAHEIEHCAAKHALRDLLFDYLEQAKRICLKGHTHEPSSEFIKRVVAFLVKTLESRFAFLVKLAKETVQAIEAEKLLAWGWEKLLNMGEEIYGPLSCVQGAGWLVARMSFLLPCFSIPDDLAPSLAGCRPVDTILYCLHLLKTDANHAVRAVEARYQRACPARA